MIKKYCLFFLFVNLFAISHDSNAMLSLKQACHNTLNNSLVTECINVICVHRIDSQFLPEDLRNEIQKRKDQLNCLLAAALDGQKCMVDCYEKNIHSLSCVSELIQSGADFSTTNRYGQSALHVAAMTNNISLVQFLLERCAPVDLHNFIHEKDIDGNTPLHCAAENNAYDTMYILINAGADLYAQNESGRMPLHITAELGTVESITLLLEHKANIEALDYFGNTPLHLAARIDNFHAVDCLLTHGAQSAIKNEDGETSLDLAYTLGLCKSAQLLKNWNKK